MNPNSKIQLAHANNIYFKTHHGPDFNNESLGLFYQRQPLLQMASINQLSNEVLQNRTDFLVDSAEKMTVLGPELRTVKGAANVLGSMNQLLTVDQSQLNRSTSAFFPTASSASQFGSYLGSPWTSPSSQHVLGRNCNKIFILRMDSLDDIILTFNDQCINNRLINFSIKTFLANELHNNSAVYILFNVANTEKYFGYAKLLASTNSGLFLDFSCLNHSSASYNFQFNDCQLLQVPYQVGTEIISGLR